MRKSYIYGLVDPTTSEIRYIGKSVNPKGRLGSHLNDKSMTHKTNWIRTLLVQGLVPSMIILEESTEDLVDAREIFWISILNKTGKLTNMLPGGEGRPVGYKPSDAERAKLSSSAKTRKKGDQANRKASIAKVWEERRLGLRPPITDPWIKRRQT